MVGKSVCGRRYIAYNEGFGLDILVYPTEVLQKIRAQKNREIRLADATCLIYGSIEYAITECDVFSVHGIYLDSDY